MGQACGSSAQKMHCNGACPQSQHGLNLLLRALLHGFGKQLAQNSAGVQTECDRSCKRSESDSNDADQNPDQLRDGTQQIQRHAGSPEDGLTLHPAAPGSIERLMPGGPKTCGRQRQQQTKHRSGGCPYHRDADGLEREAGDFA